MTIIWHNPRCSKSRQTLELLRHRGIEPDIRRYLEDPPGRQELREVLGLLGMDARALMRKGEEAYRLNGLADVMDEEMLIEAMVAEPVLIERPVVIHRGRAAIGRPPEAVLSIL